MTELREGLPPLPSRMWKLPVDARGYPVPWFVKWIDGKPDFRVADGEKMRQALYGGRCWVCGERVGKYKTFVIGPMCAVNRVSSEPPCHLDCATFSAIACPFLKLPKAQRRDANIPEAAVNPAGEMIRRNPGVTLLWTTLSYKLFNDGNGGILFNIGDPVDAAWYAESRKATRAEVLESINSGLPILREMAERQSPDALYQLGKQTGDAMLLLPTEPPL